MILLELSSPKDVYATIRTSRPYCQVFNLQKYLVLSSALQNDITPEILPDALLACTASQVSSPLVRKLDLEAAKGRLGGRSRRIEESEEYREIRRHRVSDYLAQNNRETAMVNDLRHSDLLIPLCKLSFIVDDFVGNFAKQALTQLSEYMQLKHKGNPTKDGTSPMPISKDERSRLQRALFRFEEFRRLFGGPDPVWNAMWPTDVADEHLKFLARYSPWEQVELWSVFDYLVSQMIKIVNDMEDVIFKTFQEAALRDRNGPLESLSSGGDLGVIGLSMFEDKRPQARQIRFMVELGLPFINTISNMNIPDRLATMAKFAGRKIQPTLGDIIYNSPMRYNGPEDPLGVPRDGSLWRVGNMKRRHDSLRQTGYVFWDETRLKAAGVLDLSRKDIDQDEDRASSPGLSLDERIEEFMVKDGVLDYLMSSSISSVAAALRLVDGIEY